MFWSQSLGQNPGAQSGCLGRLPHGAGGQGSPALPLLGTTETPCPSPQDTCPFLGRGRLSPALCEGAEVAWPTAGAVAAGTGNGALVPPAVLRGLLVTLPSFSGCSEAQDLLPCCRLVRGAVPACTAQPGAISPASHSACPLGPGWGPAPHWPTSSHCLPNLWSVCRLFALPPDSPVPLAVLARALCHPGSPWQLALLLVYFCGSVLGSGGAQGQTPGVLLRAWQPVTEGMPLGR